MNINDYILDIVDFPTKGIVFKDITPLLNNNAALKQTIDLMVEKCKEFDFEVILAPEARGFIFATTLAYILNKRVVLVRKKNKLPRKTISFNTTSEYDSPVMQIHEEDIKKLDKCLLVDDVYATGGTAKAIKKAIETMGASLVGGVFLIDLINVHCDDFFEKSKFVSIINY